MGSSCRWHRISDLSARLAITALLLSASARGVAVAAGDSGKSASAADSAPAAKVERAADTESPEGLLSSIQVYLTPEEARRRIFPEASAFDRDVRQVPATVKAELKRKLGGEVSEDSLDVWLAYEGGGSLLGYAVTAEEIGKYRPITFMVGIDRGFRVVGAAVLVYRESRGGEVRRSRFLRQYRGKSSRDPIRINRDIVNITGATLSVRALNFGVRKLVSLTELLYGGRALPEPNSADRG